jgi:amino acid transporter
MAIAALITGIFATFVGIILGIIALNRIKKSGNGGKGLAIAGIIVGSLGTIFAGIIVAIALAAVSIVNNSGSQVFSFDDTSYGDNAVLDALWDDCADGDMRACDDLYFDSPVGSEYEEFGDTCGHREAAGTLCTSLGSAIDPTDDAAVVEIRF